MPGKDIHFTISAGIMQNTYFGPQGNLISIFYIRNILPVSERGKEKLNDNFYILINNLLNYLSKDYRI